MYRSKVFTPLYMQKRNYLTWRAPHICSAIVSVLAPKTVIDFGCATGDLIAGFRLLGVRAIGIDKYVYPEHLVCDSKFVFVGDICKPFVAWQENEKYDLAMCVEVIGVIPPKKIITLVDNLVNSGKRIVLCADPLVRFTADKELTRRNWWRASVLEKEIKNKLEGLKRKLAVKAFYYGLSVWEEGKNG